MSEASGATAGGSGAGSTGGRNGPSERTGERSGPSDGTGETRQSERTGEGSSSSSSRRTGDHASGNNEGNGEPKARRRHRGKPKPKSPVEGGEAKTRNNRRVSDNASKRRGPPSRNKQISGVLSKYSAKIISEKSSAVTVINAKIRPSDPDFPFDMESLELDIHIPQEYPQSDAWISVRNSDIPAGYAANIELGWKEIVQMRNKSLVKYLDDLDSRLEELLKREKVSTIKIVKFKPAQNAPTSSAGSSTSQVPPVVAPTVVTPTTSNTKAPAPTKKLGFNPKSLKFVPKHIQDERQRQIDMLLHRLGSDKMSLHLKDPDGSSTFSIYIEGPNTSELLPSELQQKFLTRIFIPGDLSGCRLRIPGHEGPEISNIETNFNTFAKRHNDWSLLALVNYLSQELEMLMLAPEDIKELPVEENKPEEIESKPKESKPKENEPTEPTEKEPTEEPTKKAQTNKNVPELIEVSNETGSHTEEEDSESDHETDESETESEIESDTASMGPIKLQQKGTAVAMAVESSNIGVLECDVLNIIVSCHRCKTDNEVNNLVSGPYGRESKTLSLACEKCNQVLGVAFRKNFLHSNNDNVGYIDTLHCTVVDILPSNFTATCARCSQTHTQAFKKVELGRLKTFTCRECFLQLSVKLVNFNLEVITVDALSATKIGKVRRAKEKEPIRVGGQPLPQNGACQHYKKSTRWFRFSCCNKVFPCDRCHDHTSNHPCERALRMVCGKCSREQQFSEACTFCGHAFETKFTPFWEGGKGTRDKVKMSRRDPRKYKRRAK